jgi:hypothetical protein
MHLVPFLSIGFELIRYVASLLLVQFVPGFFITSHLRKLSVLERLVISGAVGLSLFAMQAYVFGYLGVRGFGYLYVILCGLIGFSVRNDLTNFFSLLVRKVKHADFLCMALICIGIVIQVVQMIGTGLLSEEGMRFFRVHAQDGIFHLSLIASIARQFPPIEPGASGLQVVNYHYWSDLVFAETFRLFGIPIHTLFFQFTPFVISLATAVSLLALIRFLSKGGRHAFSVQWQRFGLFFLFFGSDIAYLLMLKLHGTWGFYTSSIDNGATQFLNMPHVFAKWIFLVAVLIFLKWREEKNVFEGLLFGFLGAILFGLKIYFALLFLVIVGIYALIDTVSVIRGRESNFFFREYLLIGILMATVALCIYLPPNKGSGGLGWYPLEWVKLMLSRENVDWTDLNIRRAIALYEHNQLKSFFFDVVAIIATLLSIHGVRLLGFLFYPTKDSKNAQRFWIVSSVASAIFTFLGLYTLQQSGAFNVFNFFASSLTLLAIFSALLMTTLWERKRWWYRLFVISICLISLPRIIYETNKILSSYAQNTDVVLISAEEIDALHYINVHADPTAIIQSHPDNALDAHTPYISYFANRSSYIAGVSVLETHNQPTKSRVDALHALFRTTDPQLFRAMLADSHIRYLYLLKGEALPVDVNEAGLRIAYQNASATVYEVQ